MQLIANQFHNCCPDPEGLPRQAPAQGDRGSGDQACLCGPGPPGGDARWPSDLLRGGGANEAPYILDGLPMTRAGRRIREQYADSGGFIDHVFAVISLLGYRVIPRLRDLPSKRLHVFEPGRVPKPLTGLTGYKIREDVIVRNWPDILLVAAILASGTLPPSQLLRKFAAYPRQHELAVALREIGRVERTLFIVDWLLEADMQRRANTGLNKGEAHHALKNELRIGRQG